MKIVKITEDDITCSAYIDLLYEDFGSIDYTISRRCYQYLLNDFINQDTNTQYKICDLC